jgi:hypothetical protein
LTLPNERGRALLNTKMFLRRLLDPKKTPRVPKDIRKEAYWLLKHYPAKYEMEIMANESPDILEMPVETPDDQY